MEVTKDQREGYVTLLEHSSEEQVKWGSNYSTDCHLDVGKEYKLQELDVRSFHTKVILEDFPGLYFNSATFRINDLDWAYGLAKYKIRKGYE